MEFELTNMYVAHSVPKLYIQVNIIYIMYSLVPRPSSRAVDPLPQKLSVVSGSGLACLRHRPIHFSCSIEHV